jgi:biopolymer transport protein ExbD
MVVWSDGLRCLAAAPVRDKDTLQQEARRLADSGVRRVILLVDESVPYAPIVEILDDLLSAGIPDVVFGVSTRD